MAEIDFEYTGADGTNLKVKGKFNSNELGTVIKEGSKAVIEQRHDIRQSRSIESQREQPKLVASNSRLINQR